MMYRLVDERNTLSINGIMRHPLTIILLLLINLVGFIDTLNFETTHWFFFLAHSNKP